MTSRAFDHVVIIMFENEYRNYVLQNEYMRSLAESGLDMGLYFGVMHPSNTNYLASIAGETCGITKDPMFNTLLAVPNVPYPTPAMPAPTPLTQRTVVDELRAKKLDWRAYMETYTPIPYPPQLEMAMESGSTTTVDQTTTAKTTILDSMPYINSHNPFVRFQSIYRDADQWKRIVTVYDFLRDCLNGTLPEYSWITPNIWSIGHWMTGSYVEPDHRAPTLVDQLATWLQTFFSVLNFPGPNSRMPPKTLVVITFDEAEYDAQYTTMTGIGCDYDGPAQIYTVLLGDMIKPGRIDEGYNHYSLLKTVEKNFGLDSLGKNDTEANWFRFLWDEHFQWKPAGATPITAATFVAAAGLGDTLWVITGDGTTVCARSYKDGTWSSETTVPAPAGTTAAALAACGGELILICQTASDLAAMTMSSDGTWTGGATLVSQPGGECSLTSFTDYGDGNEKAMLVYAESGGAMWSQTYASGTWGSPVSVGQQTAGALVVAALGTSLFVIYQAAGSNLVNPNVMAAVSYNTAPFNAGPGNDAGSTTTQYLWSPSAFPVAHYWFAPDASDAGAPMPVLGAYSGLPPFAAATLDGVIHLAHMAASGPHVVTEEFSFSGIVTPQNAVNLSSAAETTGSNGWGTMAEAGWSFQVPIPGLDNQQGRTMAMARFGAAIALLTQATAGGPIAMTLGAYGPRT
jgi:Phosphoesterase family